MEALKLNLATSNSAAADSGHFGNVNITGGASSQTKWIVIVGGAVALFGIILYIKYKT